MKWSPAEINRIQHYSSLHTHHTTPNITRYHSKNCFFCDMSFPWISPNEQNYRSPKQI
jgi:hypothetical protein